MLNSKIVAACIALALPLPLPAVATAIRTFVNGITASNSTQEVHDLHIEYSNPLQAAGFLGSIPGATLNIDPNDPRKVDVRFNPKLAPAQSVSVTATTAAGSLVINRWWWTDANGRQVTRTFKFRAGGRERTGTIAVYGPHLRGDEPVPANAGEDVYTIFNKRHHWGGKNRATMPVALKVDLRPLLSRLPAGLDRNLVINVIKAALKQWQACCSLTTIGGLPKAGLGGVPANDGSGTDDPSVMAPGNTHLGGARGRKFRSLTDRECNAAFFKYPAGLSFEVITEGDAPQGDITVQWGVPREAGRAKGLGLPVADPADPDKTASGGIYMRPEGDGTSWHYGTDTDGDGFITNKDTDTVPDDKFDFYSVFKHEVGHVICFLHSGDNTFTDLRFSGAQRFDGGVTTPSGERSGFPTSIGDDYVTGREALIFASNRPGGQGGFDLWIATFEENGGTVTNLGPTINSPADELDPHLAGDGTLLLFSSNRSGSIGRFDLYESAFDLGEGQWTPARSMGARLNSPYDERHPSLSGDMGTFYFASDRSGGYGGTDIWTAEWIPGEGYSAPNNLGELVNTTASEQDPAISGDGVLLIFASDRTGGSGGYDLWRTVLRNGWSIPERLGADINSASNEMEPSLRLDNAFLVFSSDRSGGLDLFESAVARVQPGGLRWPVVLLLIAVAALVFAVLLRRSS